MHPNDLCGATIEGVLLEAVEPVQEGLSSRQIGYFYSIDLAKRLQFIVDDEHYTFVVLTYRAIYQGIAGFEYNGIAILDIDDECILVEGLARAGTGYHGVTVKQHQLFERICNMSYPEFRNFVNEQEGARRL